MNGLASLLMLALFAAIPLYGLSRGLPVYELFVTGAAQGARLCLRIFPYILAMLFAVGLFRAAGAFDLLSRILGPLCSRIGLPVNVLPLILLRPLSGSGALALTADILQTSGPDSFAGLLASVIQGSTDTTCYVLSVYYGAVGVKRGGPALAIGLAADFISFLSAFLICRLFFGGLA